MFESLKKFSRFYITIKFVSFDSSDRFRDVITYRRTQAINSVLLILSNTNCFNKAFDQCSNYGKVKNAYSYTIKDGKSYILVEFANLKIVEKLLNDAQHFNPKMVVPLRSRLLWFNSSKSKGNNVASLKSHSIIDDEIHLKLDMDRVKEDMTKATSLSKQMNILHKKTEVSELGIRLRFYLCSLLDDSLRGMFPYCSTIPFGSSINGLGKHDSDLDMLLTLDSKHLLEPEMKYPRLGVAGFLFDSKRMLPSDRQQTQRHLEAVATIMQQFLPGCCEINRILRARVPIVRFYHDKVGLSCDLSIGSNGGLEMAELLHNFGQSEPRFRPLYFGLRYWAKHWSITHPFPGKWITNFMLAVMTIHYLNEPGARAEADLGEALAGFFAFYEKFDFKGRGFSIASTSNPFKTKNSQGSSVTFPKPDYSPLFIQNPFDASHNIAKNVTGDQVGHFVQACRSSLWQLRAKPSSLVNLVFDCEAKVMEIPKGIADFSPKVDDDLKGTLSHSGGDRGDVDSSQNGAVSGADERVGAINIKKIMVESS